MNGAAANPDFHVVAHAAVQVKAALDATIGLGRSQLRFLWTKRRLPDLAQHQDEKRTGTHNGGMDAFARALVVADNILNKSGYRKLHDKRYASFDSGAGKEFEQGKLTLEQLRDFAADNGEPEMRSGRQEEYFENIINRFI